MEKSDTELYGGIVKILSQLLERHYDLLKYSYQFRQDISDAEFLQGIINENKKS